MYFKKSLEVTIVSTCFVLVIRTLQLESNEEIQERLMDDKGNIVWLSSLFIPPAQHMRRLLHYQLTTDA